MNENLTNVSGTEMSETDTDYVAAIQELQNNSVSKEQYQKLREENKKLLDALVSGQQIDLPKEEEVDINELRRALYGGETELTNLEYIDKSLKLREALLANGEQDPFLPTGGKVRITPSMIDAAEKTAQILQECVDFADGDSGVFNARFQQITNDVVVPGRKPSR